MKNKDKKLLAMGEALIDFIPQTSGKPIKDVVAFQPAVGGAPANVCGAFTKLGGKSSMITQLGTDPFGDKIIEEFHQHGIDCSYVLRTNEANTSLAFVALKENGNREFSFYRKPGADMLYQKEAVERKWFDQAFAFHFCSVSLGDFPMKDAHRQAIAYAKEAGAMVSFDPNLRPALWSSEKEMVKAVHEFIPLADVLKVSDEELVAITGMKEEEKAIEKLFEGNVKLILYTTGAGDGFIGSFLYCLYENDVTANTLSQLSKEALESYLDFANHFCSLSVQKKGAIASYPAKSEII